MYCEQKKTVEWYHNSIILKEQWQMILENS